MRPYQPAARLFAIVTAGLAASAAVWSLLQTSAVTPNQWITLLLLTALAGGSFLYPVPAAREGAAYDLANVFIFAGIMELPAGLLSVLCIVSVMPLTIRDWHRPGVLIRSMFNAGQTLLAALLAQGILAYGGVSDMRDPMQIIWVMAAILAFVAVQTFMVDAFLAWNQGLHLRQVMELDLNTLLSEAVLPIVGIAAVAVWRSYPWVFGLSLVPIVLMHRVLRTAQQIRMAQMDTKTGLYNYRHFRRLLDEELQRSRGVKRPLAVLFADLDLLREVNNRHGHLVGDHVIRSFADLLQSHCRPGDVAARFGGEEFVVLLPGTDVEEAAYIAEQIRGAAAQRRIEIQPGVTLRCTVSMGVAAFPGDAGEAEQLIQRADDAALRAKELGRNRVEMITPGYTAGPASAPAAAMTANDSHLDGGSRTAAGAVKAAAADTTAHAAPGGCSAGPAAPPPAVPSPPASDSDGIRWAAVLAGAAIALAGFWLLGATHQAYSLLAVLAGAAVVSEGFKVHLYAVGRLPTSVSPALVVTLAGAVVAGPLGALVAGLSSTVTHLVLTRQRTAWKILLNLSISFLAAVMAGFTFQVMAGPGHYTHRTVLAAVVVAVVDFVLNSGLVSLAVALRNRRSVWQVWNEQYAGLAPHLVLLGLSGTFSALAYQSFGMAGAAMFILPLVVLRHSFGVWARRTQTAIAALEQARDTMARAHRVQRQTMEQLIEAVAAILDARDFQTSDHSRQVADYAVALGRELNVSPDQIDRIKIAAMLHDLGKVGIPEAILHKPDRLTPDEYTIIKEHALIGERILTQVTALEDVARMVGEHHEAWDGGGYPRGLSGQDISLGGRIIAVADALDSITSDRPYSRAKSLEWALAEFQRCAGFQFDPAVVEALERIALKRGPSYFVNRGLSAQIPVKARPAPTPVLAAREHAS